MDKKEARTRMRMLRKNMPARKYQVCNEAITKRLMELLEECEYAPILVYRSIHNEVDTTEIIASAKRLGRKIYNPKVSGKEMDFYHVTKPSDLVPGYMGILEPTGTQEIFVSGSPGIILVPGLAYDKKGYRAGYGGGYYDRFLANNPQLIPVGLAYDFQLVEELDVDEYDLPVQYLVTDQRVLRYDLKK